MSRTREEIESQARTACEAGDVGRATTLAIRGYGPEVIGFLGGRLQNDTARDDVFAMFCEDLWRGLPGFEWRSSLRVFCYTLARNAANRYGKRVLNPGKRNVGLSGQLSALIDDVRSSTALHLRTETKTRVQRLREQLTEEERTILILRIDKQLSWAELADILSESDHPQTLQREAARLRKRFQLTKERLRELAEKDGLLDSDST